MLVLGIAYHIMFMIGLREERTAMKSAGLIYGESRFPPSMTLIIAIVLLLVGIVAIASMTLQMGPFRGGCMCLRVEPLDRAAPQLAP